MSIFCGFGRKSSCYGTRVLSSKNCSNKQLNISCKQIHPGFPENFRKSCIFRKIQDFPEIFRKLFLGFPHNSAQARFGSVTGPWRLWLVRSSDSRSQFDPGQNPENDFPEIFRKTILPQWNSGFCSRGNLVRNRSPSWCPEPCDSELLWLMVIELQKNCRNERFIISWKNIDPGFSGNFPENLHFPEIFRKFPEFFRKYFFDFPTTMRKRASGSWRDHGVLGWCGVPTPGLNCILEKNPENYFPEIFRKTIFSGNSPEKSGNGFSKKFSTWAISTSRYKIYARTRGPIQVRLAGSPGAPHSPPWAIRRF